MCTYYGKYLPIVLRIVVSHSSPPAGPETETKVDLVKKGGRDPRHARARQIVTVLVRWRRGRPPTAMGATGGDGARRRSPAVFGVRDEADPGGTIGRRGTAGGDNETVQWGRGGSSTSTRYSGSSMRSGPIATRIRCRSRDQSQRRRRARSAALLAPGDGSSDLGEHRELDPRLLRPGRRGSPSMMGGGGRRL